MHRATRRASGLAAGCLVAAALTVAAPTGATAQAATTCRGATATLVGSPGAPLLGTPQGDVVVTNGASAVSTLGGDDVVCVTGGTPYVDTAGGSDLVDTVGAGGATVSVFLGGDRDRFEGGEGADTVATDPGGLVADTDRDVILTAGGDDHVTSGSTGSENADTVDLGAGNDRLVLAGSTAGKPGAVAGGSGSDELALDLAGSAPWRVDNVAGVAKRRSTRVHRWSAFERFDLTPGQGSLRFVGSPSNEVLDLDDELLAPLGTARVSMGDGRDSVIVDPHAGDGSAYDGGPGLNSFAATSLTSALALDLVASRLSSSLGAVTLVSGVTHFAVTSVSATRATVRGNPLGNQIRVGGCVAKAQGGAGADRIKRLSSRGFDCNKKSKLGGGQGHDRLIGASGRDRLLGGEGRDRAFGGKDVDTCRAERERACER